MSTTTIPTNTKWWNGGRSPFNASYGKVMMWYFLMSDAFTFGAFLISYGTIRFSVNHWADPNQVFNAFPFAGHANLPLAFVSLMTFVLIFSSVTMVLAVHEGHKMNRKGVEKYMVLTILGGLAFLGCQAWEWNHFIHGTESGTVLTYVNEFNRLVTETVFGANLTVNEYGPASFANLFFFITGFHGFHVTIGVFLLFLVFYQAAVGEYDRRGHYEMVEKIGLYWHFVDLVWVFVFTLFYLI